MPCGTFKKPMGLSSFFLGYFFSSKNFNYITKDASILHLKSGGSNKPNYILTMSILGWKQGKTCFPFSQCVCFLLLNLRLFIVPQYIPMESNNELHLVIICSVIYLKLCSSSKVWVSMLKWLFTFSLEIQPMRIMKGEYLVLAWTPHLYPNKTLSNW